MLTRIALFVTILFFTTTTHAIPPSFNDPQELAAYLLEAAPTKPIVDIDAYLTKANIDSWLPHLQKANTVYIKVKNGDEALVILDRLTNIDVFLYIADPIDQELAYEFQQRINRRAEIDQKLDLLSFQTPALSDSDDADISEDDTDQDIPSPFTAFVIRDWTNELVPAARVDFYNQILEKTEDDKAVYPLALLAQAGNLIHGNMSYDERKNILLGLQQIPEKNRDRLVKTLRPFIHLRCEFVKSGTDTYSTLIRILNDLSVDEANWVVNTLQIYLDYECDITRVADDFMCYAQNYGIRFESTAEAQEHRQRFAELVRKTSFVKEELTPEVLSKFFFKLANFTYNDAPKDDASLLKFIFAFHPKTLPIFHLIPLMIEIQDERQRRETIDLFWQLAATIEFETNPDAQTNATQGQISTKEFTSDEIQFWCAVLKFVKSMTECPGHILDLEISLKKFATDSYWDITCDTPVLDFTEYPADRRATLLQRLVELSDKVDTYDALPDTTWPLLDYDSWLPLLNGIYDNPAATDILMELEKIMNILEITKEAEAKEIAKHFCALPKGEHSAAVKAGYAAMEEAKTQAAGLNLNDALSARHIKNRAISALTRTIPISVSPNVEPPHKPGFAARVIAELEAEPVVSAPRAVSSSAAADAHDPNFLAKFWDSLDMYFGL